METVQRELAGFQELKFLLCQAEKFTNLLNEKIAKLIGDKETYEIFFNWLLRLCTEYCYLVDKRVIIEVLVKCCYIEKTLKLPSLVIQNLTRLFPESDSLLTFFSLLFTSSQDHKRGRVITCMNRRTKKAIADWYMRKGALGLAREVGVVKSRGGWSHRDVIHMAHLSFADEDLKLVVDYIFKGWKGVTDKKGAASEASRGVLVCLEGAEAVKGATEEGEVMCLIKQNHFLHTQVHSSFLSSAKPCLNVKLALLEVVPWGGLMDELARLCRQVFLTDVFVECVLHIEEVLRTRISSLSVERSFKSIRPMEVLELLEKDFMVYDNVKNILEKLIYNLSASFEPSSKRILFVLSPAVMPALNHHTCFADLASFYVAMVARFESNCHMLPCFLDEVVPGDAHVPQISAQLRAYAGPLEQEAHVRWMEKSASVLDVVVVLTAHCTAAFFEELSSGISKYRQDRNPALKLVVINFGSLDPLICIDELDIFLRGENCRCLDIFNQVCLGYFDHHE